MGTPVDPVPATVRDALTSAANSPGYPQTAGTPQLRDAAARWLAREHGVSVDPGAVLPVIGTKEIIASLPALLGCGPDDTVVYPELAYPTYEIGARLAGARAVAADGLASLGPAAGPARLGELPGQPHRARPARRAPAQDGGLGQRAGRGPRVRRVLPRPGLGSRAGVGAPPGGQRRVRGPAAGGLLAVQAVEPGRVPGRVRSPGIPRWSRNCSRSAGTPG